MLDPTYFIASEADIFNRDTIRHYDFREQEAQMIGGFLPSQTHRPVSILITSGASCPDAIVEQVLSRVLELFPDHKKGDRILQSPVLYRYAREA